jgi:hypothetical protein
LYLYASTSVQRFKYYSAWLLAESVNNASGFGFNGYDQNGDAKWDLLTNLKPIQVEVINNNKNFYTLDLKTKLEKIKKFRQLQVCDQLSQVGTFKLNYGFAESLIIACHMLEQLEFSFLVRFGMAFIRAFILPLEWLHC